MAMVPGGTYNNKKEICVWKKDAGPKAETCNSAFAVADEMGISCRGRGFGRNVSGCRNIFIHRPQNDAIHAGRIQTIRQR